MIGTLNHVSPEVTTESTKQVAIRPVDMMKASVTKPGVGESPPPLETNLAGKPFYVNMQGQKIGSVINDQV